MNEPIFSNSEDFDFLWKEQEYRIPLYYKNKNPWSVKSGHCTNVSQMVLDFGGKHISCNKFNLNPWQVQYINDGPMKNGQTLFLFYFIFGRKWAFMGCKPNSQPTNKWAYFVKDLLVLHPMNPDGLFGFLESPTRDGLSIEMKSEPVCYRDMSFSRKSHLP